jgi:hypothetical protein
MSCYGDSFAFLTTVQLCPCQVWLSAGDAGTLFGVFALYMSRMRWHFSVVCFYSRVVWYRRETWRLMSREEPTVMVVESKEPGRMFRPRKDEVVGGYRQFRSSQRIARMKNAVFWDVTPYGSSKNRRFGGTWRLHHQGRMNR